MDSRSPSDSTQTGTRDSSLDKGLERYLHRIAEQLEALPVHKWQSSGELIKEAAQANRPIIQSEYFLYQPLADRFLVLRVSQSVRSKKLGDIYNIEPSGPVRYFVYLPDLGTAIDAMRANLEISGISSELPEALLSGEPAQLLFESLDARRNEAKQREFKEFSDYVEAVNQELLKGELGHLHLEDLELAFLHGARISVSCSLLDTPESLGKVMLHCTADTETGGRYSHVSLEYRTRFHSVEIREGAKGEELTALLVKACHLKSISSLSKELELEMREK